MREWIYGRNPVYETLLAGRRQAFRLRVSQGAQPKGRLDEILQLARRHKLPVESVPRQVLERLADGHQGIALETSAYPYCTLPDILDQASAQNEPPFILILDALQDPQNMGTLLRTAEITGIHGVILPLARTATITPAVVNASAGASEHLLVAQANLAQSIAQLKENDIWVVGLDSGASSKPINEVRLDGRLAFVVGNEGQGMRDLVRNSCDLLLRLPMRGKIESLNAAIAGSVGLYLAWQARSFAGERGSTNSQ